MAMNFLPVVRATSWYRLAPPFRVCAVQSGTPLAGSFLRSQLGAPIPMRSILIAKNLDQCLRTGFEEDTRTFVRYLMRTSRDKNPLSQARLLVLEKPSACAVPGGFLFLVLVRILGKGCGK
jgi:hypothetical protein